MNDPSITDKNGKFQLRSVKDKQLYDIPMGITKIGRDTRKCDIVLTDESNCVSREHAEIRRSGDDLQIVDLGSHNHTFVNGRDIYGSKPVKIFDGDQIGISQFTLVVTDGSSPTPDSGRPVVVPESKPHPLNKPSSISANKGSVTISAGDKRLFALVSISKSLSRLLRTDEILENAIDTLLKVFGSAQRCIIGYVSKEGAFEPKWWKIRQGDQSPTILVSQRIVRQILETAEVLLLDDAMEFFEDPGSAFELNLRSIMCAPLVDADGRVFGMLQVDSQSAGIFSGTDLEVFAAAAVQIGLAINFSHLHARALDDALMRSDLEQARFVQRQFLPAATPPIENYEFADHYSPARQIGGDYFDYIVLDAHRIAIILADVVGKGAPAALNMVKLATETRATFEITQNACEVMSRLNRRLSGSFITCVIMIIDARSHSLTITNAGHELPLLRTRTGSVSCFGDEVTRVPLSVDENCTYVERTFPVEIGDTIVVFSDGFVDAENSAKRQRFGRQRIQDLLANHEGTSEEFKDSLVNEVHCFTGGSAQFDDMCLICLKRTR